MDQNSEGKVEGFSVFGSLSEYRTDPSSEEGSMGCFPKSRESAIQQISALNCILGVIMSKVIDSFRGKFHWLSNFYSCSVHYEGLTFGNTEAAFQAAKCLDMKERERFFSLSGGQAKRLGKRVELRPDWEDVKIDIMRQVLKSKFTQNPELREKLIATGDAELIEGNNWRDFYWGVCNGKGQNHLGKLLMEVRVELKGE